MLDENQKDRLADWFWQVCRKKELRFASSVEDAFIEKVETLLNSGLLIFDARNKAFDFVVESQRD